MKVSEFLGKKVLDKNAVELGKVSEMDVEPKKGLMETVIISTGEIAIRKNDLVVTSKDIAEVGDYVILNIDKQTILNRIHESKEEEPARKRINLKKSE
ncbi:PRC-barrel domain-containing protein [Methanobacterium aggregans]|uniref:PRC-barrel domain-containing protein n=1 Tax=Methanobacterium aggregans TaxID=1615586 RepID=UPI001AE75226|nr:PRC-barrel domain-containing protein [Methanobacterium aggregans]MBP2046835.1 sporulation protein YlmC with PRC-barrel domain [Methanobacterium aggregans]